VAHDGADVEFGASTELGALDETRQAIGGGVFVGDAFTGLETSTAGTGFYFSDTLALGERVALTVSGRYNRTHIVLEDLLDDALDGDHTFERFNPAVGLAVGGDAVTFYASYSEASRAPSPVELTCADEDDPCRLPNAFVADPPLEQVVAATYEAGVRGDWTGGGWHAGVFRTTNDDDILFISAGALTNEGFFDNVGETRRDGFEANLSGAAGERLTWSLDYTYLDATFRESFAVTSPNHPEAIAGEIEVESGDRLPLIPQHLAKAGVSFAVTDALTIAADVYASSGAHFRGDEGNLLDELDGYSVVGVRAEYRFGERASVFASIDNLLDEEYETFGLFGLADEVLGPEFDEPYFVGPGAPRAAWIGIRFAL
jgi:iron complex outermembrane recepter protein